MQNKNSFNRHQGDEVETLEPELTRRKAGLLQPLLMGRKGFRDHHLLQRSAFLTDLQIAVTLSPLELVVQFVL